MPDFNIRRDLPAFQTMLVELLPQQAGTFVFTCGMGMLRGSLVVKQPSLTPCNLPPAERTCLLQIA